MEPATYTQLDTETSREFILRLYPLFLASEAPLATLARRDGRMVMTIYINEPEVDPLAVAWGQQRGLISRD